MEGRIVEVATAGTISRDRAATVLSGEGLYALPGLIDVHAHIGDGGLGPQSEEDRTGALGQFLRYGVTSIFVPGGGGGNDHQLARWKERCGAVEFPCPGLYGSGALITARRGVFYVATLALYDGFIDHAFGRFDQEPFAAAGISPRALESLEDEAWRSEPHDTPEAARAIQAALYENLRRATAASVPLALGTDVNNPTVFPGYSVHEELALMVEAGLSPAQALTAATRGGAAFLGKGETLGKIAPGYEADILLLSANPLEDILATRNLHTVLTNGRRVEGIPRSHGSAAPN